MRVLILSQHFSPEITAARFRVEAFTRALIERGHEVEVVCAVPNHPEGVIAAGYQGRALVRKRSGDGLGVNYVWVWTGPEKSTAARLLNYGSFAAMATTVASMLPRPDVILATSPPLSVGAVGAIVATRHRVPWVLDVRDLWPKAAEVLGEVTDERVLRAAARLERGLYGRASRVVAVTEPFRRHVADRAPTGKLIDVVPNGTTREWLQRGEHTVERGRLGLPGDRFILAYAGNLGYYHALDVVIEAAAELDDSFQLLLIGHGPLRAQLEQRAAELPAGRVEMLGLMKPEQAAARLRAADALVVSLRASLPDVLSSKLFDYCALGRPVIVSAAGETRRVVEQAGAALTVEPEEPAALAAAVRTLRDDPGLGQRLAAAGRELASEYLRETQAEAMTDILEETARR